jgi:hypothetical protein
MKIQIITGDKSQKNINTLIDYLSGNNFIYEIEDEAKSEVERIKAILKALPTIRKNIKDGMTWSTLYLWCEPLGLSDTAFRENPSLDDFLVSDKYWMKRLKEAQAKGVK